MKTCLIITGGKIDESFARSFLEKEPVQKIIAVDRGLETVWRLGLVPDYIVGDFDSVDDQVLGEFKKLPFIVWEQHKPEKNETDTELARDRAMTLGCGRVIFLGATGGRLDHMLANIHTLYGCMEKGAEAYLVDAQNRISGELHREYVGKRLTVLVDGESEDREYPLSSRTEGNRLVRLKGDKSLIGRFLEVKITGSNTWALYGEPV